MEEAHKNKKRKIDELYPTRAKKKSVIKPFIVS